MPVNLSFDKLIEYDTREAGITVPVKLSAGQNEAVLGAKLDTGSTHCVFERKHGERLGLEIENGEPLYFSTATGRFLTFGHELTVSVLGIEVYTMVYFIDSEEIVRNILGRQGWIDRIRLGLIDYEGKLFLNSYSE